MPATAAVPLGALPTAAPVRATASSNHAEPKAETEASADQRRRARREAWEQLFVDNEFAHVPERWVQGFYPLYEKAQRAFGVNWLLLASVHRQETAFSTADTTYHGLNFAGCCAGSMQFNVKNGPPSTWVRFRDAYKRAERPTDYPNETEKHPSIYDDFDAMMAAGSLLRYSGAGAALDAGAWRAAYDYYGHDRVGVDYADQVLARAIGWSQTGFRINQGLDPKLVEAVHAAWGAPVADELERLAEQQKERKEKAEDEGDTTTPTAEDEAPDE
jgi:hypothetical protein